ncbi:3-dehydro-L-gulonate 2-dehydrogenase [Paenibacillus ginsengarvi]|uniref:3-dehydro-L-gulonate 2-dehydrogenase n=1 Tax=Paenibacillus ginsengarvi TaxID=400777 RepID=A0A3B0CML7_9BACL|nr:3-dehydro-L-gulonate 2-dehydrogenase [Paenibacillus ginsengarvi]RKN86422.1 3-dehydro-L-gulonate 2-dehydrogenase [Paenibacillus ginsengarvi]
MRIPFETMFELFRSVLVKNGFRADRAELCARLFTETSRDGVYSHGLNRFPTFIDYIRKGYVRVEAEPELAESMGVLERWDGHSGPGNLNAHASMTRAIELAKQHGVGCVAIRNTNHWMRAGSYGWQAAEAGCVGICWTNTIPNMPPWGAKDSKLGNNPVVFAAPRTGGEPIVLDIAMSQFSYGKMGIHAASGEPLPVYGGFDREGNPTQDAAAIIETRRSMPIGFWKGSGLSFMLDLIVTMLSGGNSSMDMGKLGAERNLSQVFIAIDAARLPDRDELDRKVLAMIDDLHAASPDENGGRARYPGEETLRVRERNLREGIPVDEAIWEQALKLDA